MRTASDWNNRYETGNLPWDSGLVSGALVQALVKYPQPPGRVLELGCGTGTNAIYLAKLGWQVTAVDFSPAAIEMAGRKAASAQVSIQFLCADVSRPLEMAGPFTFLFDRGCYHSLREFGLPGYLENARRLLPEGAPALFLCGNAYEKTEFGPPRVSLADLHNDLSGTFEFLDVHSFRFTDPGGTAGPLGWSCWAQRRASVA